MPNSTGEHILVKREKNSKSEYGKCSGYYEQRIKSLWRNKRLLYISIIRPIWSYAAVIWSCTADSNILILQRFQNLILRKITGAPWYISNEQLHTDLQVGTVKEVINRLTE